MASTQAPFGRGDRCTPAERLSAQKGPLMAEQLDAPIPRNDARDVDLQAQVDGLRQALRDWRRTREYSQPTEERLAHITLQCARMVDTWQQAERRRSTAVAAADDGPEWTGADAHVQQATGERIRALERAIEREWNSLPESTDEAPGHLSAQVVSLAESCVTAANLTLRSFANAESRLAALEQDLQTHMRQLSRDLQSVLAELRSARPPSLPGTAPAFPLESVMRIHEELRESDGASRPAPDALKPAPLRPLPQASEPDNGVVARLASLERTVESVAEAAAEKPRSSGWRPLYTVAAIVIALAGLALTGLWMQRRIDARLNEAAGRVAAAERQRDEATATTREQASRQIAEAQQSAAKAQVVANILAAPDLVRYWLTGASADSRAYAQILFSRSRGMVFSASRLEQPGEGRTYQLWFLTRGEPVNGGLITPDSAGRVTLATDTPIPVEGRLVGAVVTVEAAGGGARPSTERVLIRAELAPAVPPATANK
jgi:anti-sigma-K factor RskA